MLLHQQKHLLNKCQHCFVFLFVFQDYVWWTQRQGYETDIHVKATNFFLGLNHIFETIMDGTHVCSKHVKSWGINYLHKKCTFIGIAKWYVLKGNNNIWALHIDGQTNASQPWNDILSQFQLIWFNMISWESKMKRRNAFHCITLPHVLTLWKNKFI